MLVREREHEEGGAHFVFGLVPFVGLGRAAVRHLFVLTTCLQQRKRRPSHLPPSNICTTPPLLQSRPLAAISNSHFTYRYRTSHSQAPSPPHARSHTGACTPAPRRARPPPRGKRTLPCPSVCAAGVLYEEGVRLAGVDGRGAGLGGKRMREMVATRKARVWTDEDSPSVRAWRFASGFSAWDAEAVEEEGRDVLLPLRVAVGVIRYDHDVTSRSNSQP